MALPCVEPGVLLSEVNTGLIQLLLCHSQSLASFFTQCPDEEGVSIAEMHVYLSLTLAL